MVRTQIQLTERQARSLKRLARQHRCSMAELVRRGVEFVLGSEGASPRELRARAALLSGKYRSGKRDISREHDRYLAQAYKA